MPAMRNGSYVEAVKHSWMCCLLDRAVERTRLARTPILRSRQFSVPAGSPFFVLALVCSFLKSFNCVLFYVIHTCWCWAVESSINCTVDFLIDNCPLCLSGSQGSCRHTQETCEVQGAYNDTFVLLFHLFTQNLKFLLQIAEGSQSSLESASDALVWEFANSQTYFLALEFSFCKHSASSTFHRKLLAHSWSFNCFLIQSSSRCAAAGRPPLQLATATFLVQGRSNSSEAWNFVQRQKLSRGNTGMYIGRETCCLVCGRSPAFCCFVL